MGLFWFGASLGLLSKFSLNKMKRRHLYYRPWEFFTWTLGMGIAMVYYDAYRRKLTERLCEREEYGDLMYDQKLHMVQDVWLQEPAIKKEHH